MSLLRKVDLVVRDGPPACILLLYRQQRSLLAAKDVGQSKSAGVWHGKSEVLLAPKARCCHIGTKLELSIAAGVLVCVQAFVQFADVASAQRAKDAISGRMFAGSIVQAYHVPVNVFQQVPESIH